VIFLILAALLFLAVLAVGWIWTWRQWRKRDGNIDWVMGLVLSLCGTFIALLVGGLATGGITSIPDGCYRVVTTNGVGIASTGKSVIPIVTSDRTYIPIQCP